MFFFFFHQKKIFPPKTALLFFFPKQDMRQQILGDVFAANPLLQHLTGQQAPAQQATPGMGWVLLEFFFVLGGSTSPYTYNVYIYILV